ncbi:hypothetical protein [Phenylobacterium sp.]|jgi:hypothetical protein|uniref:hypothetical protein n=1 Tax=Phenylobacterium sp. TaxID=1871053 RepID=UPI0037C861E2
MDAAAQKRLSFVDAAETEFAVLSDRFDAAGLSALRAVVSGYPDTGAPGAGEVTASLFMLLERLISDVRMDHQAIAVHLRAWRLMLTTNPDAEATRLLINGLKAIRDHSTQNKAA